MSRLLTRFGHGSSQALGDLCTFVAALYLNPRSEYALASDELPVTLLTEPRHRQVTALNHDVSGRSHAVRCKYRFFCWTDSFDLCRSNFDACRDTHRAGPFTSLLYFDIARACVTLLGGKLDYTPPGLVLERG